MIAPNAACVPKALLKSVKRQAKARGDSLDDVVSTALQSYLDRA